MNGISTSAPPARSRPLSTVSTTAGKLGKLIAPKDHAGKGNWSNDAEVPWQAWPASVGFAAFFIWGWDLLNWLLPLVS